jgi:hypothetical protein
VAGPITSPAISLLVYNTKANGTVPNNVTPGYYYWDGAKWVKFMVNNNNTIDLGYILGWSSNTAPPDYLLPLSGGTYNWADYPDFQSFFTTYGCQFITNNGATFTLANINTSGRFLRGGTSAGVNQNSTTALPTVAFTTNTTGAHVHSVDPPTTTTSSTGDHNHLEGEHAESGVNFGIYGQQAGTTSGYRVSHTNDKYTQNYTSTAGAHTHTLDIVAFNSASAGDHAHTVTGGGDAETRPINTSVIWCIKVKPTATSGTINITNTANTAINGLSVYGSAVGLGGNLNQSTTINQTTYPLAFTTSTTNGFSVDGSTLSVDGTNHRVGIGTNTPSQKLDVNGAALLQGGGPLYLLDATHGIKSESGKGVTIFSYQVPTGIFLQQTTGYVGLGGTTAPQTTLHVKGNAGLFNLEGTDHSYIQWYPKGFSNGRKAYTGFGSAASNDFSIANENTNANISINPNGTGKIQANGNNMIEFRKFLITCDNCNYNTGFSTTDWNCAVTGFTHSNGNNESRWYPLDVSGVWNIYSDVESKTDSDKAVWVMFTRKEISNRSGF